MIALLYVLGATVAMAAEDMYVFRSGSSRYKAEIKKTTDGRYAIVSERWDKVAVNITMIFLKVGDVTDAELDFHYKARATQWANFFPDTAFYSSDGSLKSSSSCTDRCEQSTEKMRTCRAGTAAGFNTFNTYPTETPWMVKCAASVEEFTTTPNPFKANYPENPTLTWDEDFVATSATQAELDGLYFLYSASNNDGSDWKIEFPEFPKDQDSATSPWGATFDIDYTYWIVKQAGFTFANLNPTADETFHPTAINHAGYFHYFRPKCTDLPNPDGTIWKDLQKYTCAEGYIPDNNGNTPNNECEKYSQLSSGLNAKAACCTCGGGRTYKIDGSTYDTTLAPTASPTTEAPTTEEPTYDDAEFSIAPCASASILGFILPLALLVIKPAN